MLEKWRKRVQYKKSNSRLKLGAKHNQFSSNSSSYIIGSAAEDSIMFNTKRSSLKFVGGTPIKKLLAEEMAKENESKRRQPGLIARLMGLDGLPPQNPLQKEDKHCLGTHKQKSASMDLDMKTKPHVRRSIRRTTSLGEQEFRDVYEIPETRRTVQPKEEMTQCSKHFSHRDQFTKSHQQRGTCIAVTKPPKSPIHKSNNIGLKPERKGLSVDAKCCRQQYDSSALSENNVHGSRKCIKSSKTQLEASHETDTIPTRIVVLKPNLEQMKATNKSISSPVSSHGSFSKSRSEDSREIAKVVTRRMRKCVHKHPVELSSILLGYAGDESSFESDSANESEVTLLTSGKLPLSSPGNRETKKRLSERWRMSQRRKGVEVSCQGNTLGEMLDKRALVSDSSSYRDDGDWSSPLGISSMDGWRGVSIQNPKNGRSKEMKERKFYRREVSSSRNLRSNSKKLRSSQRICNSSSDSSGKECVYEPQIVADEEGILSENKCSLAASNFAPGLDMIESSESPSDEFPPPKISTGLESSCSPTCDKQSSKTQVLEVEEDQPSPVSVLEAPSSPNCFESVSVGLQELKMQLKLLKMESGECAENAVEDIDSVTSEDENLPSSYLADVLTDFCNLAIWYSPDCPLGRGLFEKLENKYCCNNSTWPRCERMLLFDRINICLFEIFQTLDDDDDDSRNVMELKHKVQEELENEEKGIHEEITERMVDREMQWPDIKETINVIGKDFEKLLLNDLIENAAFTYY
ncbi:uncharacterized protein LOC124920131 [Impatiens glandulifera]|uniref:uncharacterized protein LOC124920131 n=1 Tax=Impatiens glandulifera TaxID=253017 RepID=UPI001FB1A229|nr:uncharacterized protein LOC124920131 [Impatiens glandulifera]